MNYYNPYFYTLPTATKSSGLAGLLSKIKFSSIVNGTSKTLNLVNQAIPVVKQVSPMIKNAKTMFRVMNEFKKTDTTTNNVNNIIDNDRSSSYDISKNIPTFFV